MESQICVLPVQTILMSQLLTGDPQVWLWSWNPQPPCFHPYYSAKYLDPILIPEVKPKPIVESWKYLTLRPLTSVLFVVSFQGHCCQSVLELILAHCNPPLLIIDPVQELGLESTIDFFTLAGVLNSMFFFIPWPSSCYIGNLLPANPFPNQDCDLPDILVC